MPSPWSFALLSSRNSATMVTWRHTSPLYSVWKLINLFVNDTITAFCRTICLPSFISNVTNNKDKLWKTARLTSKLKNHDCNPCFSSFQVCHSVSPFVFVLYLFFVLIISAVVFIYQSLCGSSRYLFDKFASCPRAYETWEQWKWIIRTLTCKHKIWGGNCLYLRPYLKAFPIFNVLETCRVYLLTIDLGIVKCIKKFSWQFFEKCEICMYGPNYV